MPLPVPLGPAALMAWRVDHALHKDKWDSGEGAFRVGGRWNSKGSRYVVYCALDPATAILEVAVHKCFRTLDTVPHVLTGMLVDPSSIPSIHVVNAAELPNANWLSSGVPSIGQQEYGDDLLARHDFVLVPSVVSRHSWNLIFDRNKAERRYSRTIQEAFHLDTRLHAAP